MERRVGDHRVVGRDAVAEPGHVGPVETRAGVGDVLAGGVEGQPLGLVEVDLLDPRLGLERRARQPAPACAEIGHAAAYPALEQDRKTAAAGVGALGREHARRGDEAFAVRGRLGAPRPKGDFRGQGVGPGQPEDAAMCLHEGAVEADLPRDLAGDAVDPFALRACDRQPAAGRRYLQASRNVAEAFGPAAGEVHHYHRGLAIQPRRNDVPARRQCIVQRTKALHAL